ncbi:hypothetical protein R6242_12235, partial [Iodobacter sp. CM08]|nr:hypothetical protein [Iodobacter sp. CM08]
KNSRPLITQTPLFRTTEAHGQFLGRDFNPLAKLLLLRTPDPFTFVTFSEVQKTATQWLLTYKNESQHMRLGGITPKQKLALHAQLSSFK